MFRRPPDTNPPSRPTTLQAPTKTPIIQRGNVASLVQLHNTRVQGARAEPSALSRTPAWQNSGRIYTIRDGANNPLASRLPQWNTLPQESRKNGHAFPSRRTSFAQQQPTIPHGHDTRASPPGTRTSAVQRRDTRLLDYEQSRQSPPGTHVPDHHKWPLQSHINRNDPWARRVSGHCMPSQSHRNQESHLTTRFERLDQSPPTRTPERRESWVRRTLRSPRMQPISDESIPSISEPEVREWSLKRDTGGGWTTRRTPSEQTRSSYTDSRQGLFYGDLSPPHPPVPQASPAVERPNPWRRRDSSGSTVRSRSPQARRESVSHRAFERVRSMSPPSINEKYQIHTPAPHRPSDTSIATYITRKLSQQWTDAPDGTLRTPAAFTRVPLSSPSHRAHHIDSSLVQDILSSIDSVLAEHTTALQTVITKSHQLLHEKELICPSVSPRHSPKAVPSPVYVSPQHQENEHSSRSTSPKSPSLIDPPQLLRRRTTSVPKLLQLIDSTATYMGLPVSPQRDSLTLSRELSLNRSESLRRSYTEPELSTRRESQASVTVQGLRQSSIERQSPLQREDSSRMSKKASTAVIPPRIRVSEERQPLIIQPPNTRQPSPGMSQPVSTQAIAEQERITSATQGLSSLPSLAVLTPSSSSSTISPLGSVRRLPLSDPQQSTTILPSEEVDESHSSRPMITTVDYLGSRNSSPRMFTHSNMPSPDPPNDLPPPVMEYDREAALVERATRNSVKEIPVTFRRQNSVRQFPAVPLEPVGPTLIRNNTTPLVPATAEAVMEPEPVHAGDVEDSRVSRSRTRQVSDSSEGNKRKLSHYDRQRKHKKRSATQSSSFHSASSTAPSFDVTAGSPLDSPEPQVPRTRTSSPIERSEDREHAPATEPPHHPAESTTRPRPPMRSLQGRLPSPWQARESRRESRRLVSESRDEHEKPTPDHGPRGQFWATRGGAEMGRKWFGRHGVGEWGSGYDDDFVP